jgi:hypothetical protein
MIHLRVGTTLTQCGRHLNSYTSTDPTQVTCQICLGETTARRRRGDTPEEGLGIVKCGNCGEPTAAHRSMRFCEGRRP